MDYYPYGDIRLDEKAGTFSEQRKFAGHEYDADTGLSYMNARYYNGKIGRFVSQDPVFLAAAFNLADPQSLNSYAYARNNPLRYIDPTGEIFETPWDLANVVYDAGRLVKNTAELGYGAAKYEYGALTNNQVLKSNATNGLRTDWGDLKSAGFDTIFDTGATLIPFVPAGVTKVDDAVSLLNKGEKNVKVYQSIDKDYVGITKNLENRAKQHMKNVNRQIAEITDIQFTRSQARGIEQALIEKYGLGKLGGQLENKINSISRDNPIYKEAVSFGKSMINKIIKQ